MKTFLDLISTTCTQLVTWFDGTLRHLMDVVTHLANVAIRVLLAYALYALFVQDVLLKAIAAF